MNRNDAISYGAVGAAALLLALLASSCAVGSAPSCESDADCVGDQVCRAGTCQALDTGAPLDGSTDGGADGGDDGGGTTGEDAGDTRPRDGGDGFVPPKDGEGDTRDTSRPSGDADADTGPTGCGGRCGIGEQCVSGACVSACQPTCSSNEQCADRGDGPQCYPTCNEANSTNGCSQNGTRCIDIDPNPNDPNEILICADSQCRSNSDCQSGTCIRYVNDYGRCIPSGPKTIGDSCDLRNASDRCERGAICLGDPSQPTGTCRKLCNPWASNPGCSGGSRCALFKQTGSGFSSVSLRQGWCKPNTTSSGTSSLQVCSPQGAMCDHATLCAGSGSSSRCFKWCRPGRNDCAGTMPQWVGASAVCNNYILSGVRKVGRCLPECPSRACPDGFTCRNNKCRETCTSKADCCGGSTVNCNWSCNGGLCE